MSAAPPTCNVVALQNKKKTFDVEMFSMRTIQQTDDNFMAIFDRYDDENLVSSIKSL